MGGWSFLGRRRRRGMALLVVVDAWEHPVVMDKRIDGWYGGLDWIGGGRLVLVIAAFDRCTLLSIWKAEGTEWWAEVEIASCGKKGHHGVTLSTLCYMYASLRCRQNIISVEERHVLG